MINRQIVAKVCICTDTHFRDTDFSTIGNYCNVVEKTWLDLCKKCEDNGITHLIHTGDICDKGYHSTHMCYNHENLLRKMSNIVNGNFYMCIGNHFYIERDYNPEIYLIQPNSKYKPIKKIYQEVPIVKCEDKLIIENVQFTFFHFSKNIKDYITTPDSNVKYHIGIYHDDVVVPSSVRSKLNYYGDVSDNYISRIYENVDLAVLGHIHCKVGLVQFRIRNRVVPIIIPGALSITQNTEVYKHNSVDLPIITIYKGGGYSLSYMTIDTYMNELSFYKKREPRLAEMTKNGEVITSTAAIARSNLKLHYERGLPFEEYLKRNGYSPEGIELYYKTSLSEVSISDAIAILMKRSNK